MVCYVTPVLSRAWFPNVSSVIIRGAEIKLQKLREGV
jgi:hypothetical protein